MRPKASAAAERAAAFLKAKLKEADVTYAELVKRLKKHGFKETKASNPWPWGTFQSIRHARGANPSPIYSREHGCF